MIKKIILLLVLINVFHYAYTQTVRGVIIDKSDNRKISFASIYINGTSVGTNSDLNGQFELNIKKYSSLPLTVSALGYFTVTLTDYSGEKPVEVYLTPKIFEFNEVVVEAKSTAKERGANLKMFKEQFLGSTYNGQNCVILNEGDITFKNDDSHDTLKAFASKPILIINNALGFKITYYLDKFEYSRRSKSFLYRGNAFFNEDMSYSLSQKNFFEKRRKNTFLGSRTHLFSSLYTNSLKSNGFVIENSSNEILNFEDLVFSKDSLKKYLVYQGNLKVLSLIPGKSIQNIKTNNTLRIYYLSKTPNSYIELLKDTIYIDRSGYFEGSGVRILGKMAIQRVGDLLPYDYNPVLQHIKTIQGYSIVNDSLTIPEKVYLHTDRSYYFPGEDIWFKAYLIDAFDRLLTNHSKNLHVDLISPSLKIISHRIIRLDNGLGNGDFRLSDSILSGKYNIRAYTNYMRNFGDQLFFTKEINVISPNDKQKGNTDSVKFAENNIQLSFFPEGGSLVDNVPSIVAFKAVNGHGKGCDISGKIYSSNGDLITTFRSTHLGMGTFFLRPLPELSYSAVFKGADSSEVRTELPESFSDGVTFSASINQDNELTISTKSNPQTFQLVSELELLLRFSMRKEVIKTVLCKVKAPVTNFIIPIDDLPDGILMLTLSTLDDTPLAERLVYIEKEAPVRIRIETDKLSYNKREPVSLEILLPGDSTTERKANISLAVVNKNFISTSSQFQRNISSWFLLESDIRGTVEDPSYYFDPSNTARLKDLNLLLLTQGWRDFAWKYDKTYYQPENGFTISGRLRKYNFNKAIAKSRVSIGIFGHNGSFLETVPVDSTGRFSLSGIDITGDARLIVTGIGKKDRLKGEIHLDSVFYIPAKVIDSMSRVSFLLKDNWSYLKTYYEINESIRRKYKLSDTIGLGEVKIIAERHKDPQTVKIESSRIKYGQPDAEVKITEEMQSYGSPIEILKGHVPGVAVTGSYPDYRIIIRGLSSINAQGSGLVLIDGNEARFEDLIYMPIHNIDRIDVLKSYGSTSIFGFNGSSGVINLITKTEGSDYVPVKYSVNIKISGYNSSRIFYSPQHLKDSNSAYDPDLRSTLLWEPDINLEVNKEVSLHYFNGDNSSVIKIIAEGITSTGIPVIGVAEYEIR